MTTRSKIVGLNREINETDPETAAAPISSHAEGAVDDDYALENHVIADEASHRAGTGRYITSALLLTAFAGWSTFFGMTYWSEAQFSMTNDRIVSLVVTWAIPTLLIAVLWLLTMRNSSREAVRFGKIAQLLRTESDALAIRMRTVTRYRMQ